MAQSVELAKAFHSQIALGNVPGVSDVHKFGRNAAVGTSYVPICLGGIYRMPKASAGTALRIKAGGNAADDAAGLGAQAVTLQGLSITGALQTSVLATAGASASADTAETYMRLFRGWVSASGAYYDIGVNSHEAAITIEKAAGSEDWMTIDATDHKKAQSQIGAYSVPLGKTALLKNILVTAETSKVLDVIIGCREGILDVAAPYEAFRTVKEYNGLDASLGVMLDPPIGPLAALTDVLALAKVSTGTAKVTVDMVFEVYDD